jgi:hypothetical protein
MKGLSPMKEKDADYQVIDIVGIDANGKPVEDLPPGIVLRVSVEPMNEEKEFSLQQWLSIVGAVWLAILIAHWIGAIH